MHGSKGGRPIVNGTRSERLAKVRDELAEKIEQYLDDEEPDSLDQELAILKALRDRALEKDGDVRVIVTKKGNEVSIEYDSTPTVAMLTDTIRKTAASRTRMRNQTAYTQASIALILANIADIIRKYVPEGERAAVAREIRSAGGLLSESGEPDSA